MRNFTLATALLISIAAPSWASAPVFNGEQARVVDTSANPSALPEGTGAPKQLAYTYCGWFSTNNSAPYIKRRGGKVVPPGEWPVADAQYLCITV